MLEIIEINLLGFGLLYSYLTKPGEVLSSFRLMAFKDNAKILYCAPCLTGWITILTLIIFKEYFFIIPFTTLNMLIVKFIDDRL